MAPLTDELRKWLPAVLFGCLVLLAASMPASIAGVSITLGIACVLAAADFVLKPAAGWRRTPLDESLGVLLGLTLLSALTGPWLAGLDPLKSLVSFGSAWIFLTYYFMVWYAPGEERIRVLVGALVAVGAVIAVYAILQHYTGLDLFGKGLGRTSVILFGETARWIAKGTFGHHQTFANVFCMIFCLAFSLTLVPAPRPRRLFMWALSALLALALFFSYTRGIWLATLVAVVVIVLFKSRKAFRRGVVALVLVWGLVLIVPSTLQQRARSIFNLSRNVDRLLIWETSWAMLRDHPIVGIGLGNYTTLQAEYAPRGIDVNRSRSHAHNSYLQLAIERGLLALVAFAWVWYVVLRIGFSSLNFLRGREGFRLGALRGATAGVVAFLADGFFQNNFGDTEVLSVVLFLVAIIVSLRVKQTERDAARLTGGAHATT